MEIVVHGLSHRTASLDLRERVALLPEESRLAVRELQQHDAIHEVAVLSTCNRTELYVIVEDRDRALEAGREWLARMKEVDLNADPSLTYTRSGRDCVEHLFRVAGGIDSMVIGEAGILGQVKTAFEEAQSETSVGAIFQRLFPWALRVGKRSRSETEIARGAASLEKASVQLARKVYGDLSKHRILVVGAGDTGARVAGLLRDAGATRLAFANRTTSKATALAEQHNGRVADFGHLETEIQGSDIVVTAINTSEPAITRAMIQKALHRRRQPMLFVDLGVPRNIEPSASQLENVFLYAVDGLQELVDLNLGRRAAEVPHVERIISEEVRGFELWMDSLQTAPVVVALREHVESIRVESLGKVKGSMSAQEREMLERFSVTFMNRVLHAPTTSVRDCNPNSHEGRSRLAWLRRAFGLDDVHRNGDSGEEE